ncbi:hypothetical protein G6F50_017730 [Rhizopus delemar]|uniref:Uncharacterized protein n=1 Tax=Rhizopus delemar TaxID=936053 RepID=A0A9P7BZC9_9FUNG|nr:hypothetical protein G6F50_017730 [Rhizopus delemar]
MNVAGQREVRPPPATRTRSRPCALAWYIAASAARSRVRQPSASVPPSATPKLAVTRSAVPPPTLMSSCCSANRSDAASRRPASRSPPASSTRNSSPP